MSKRSFEYCPDRVDSWEDGGYITCGTIELPIEHPQGRCETGWEEHEISTGPACLQVNREKVKIIQALKSCHEQGSRLAQPQNYKDNVLFVDVVGIGNGYDLWLAMSDASDAGLI